ncbi:LLM class flavin-dependent oxidoreductase [Actinoplanes sp. TRM 88003]|uniref:LLM class flavin-dependent oxidoreductase n=1 Tax=Paractinoplanes aksuensis TaxID=2939490 RepID=A0ABT1DJ21_9ACTN|nr:LLM class flavin-dependent oxidoreductase [Actinoplanes aksuensis]MCO8270794.1 LLM class flavin-dependent oxidoreductase [Actinoplanes aksuensis]
MEIGVILPSVAVQEREQLDLPAAARHAEELGLDSVWHGDHLATGMPSLDCAVALAAAAAGTSRIRIGASVFIPAIRPLAWAAKQIASLQHVSKGRLILGIGSGGGETQWAAAGVPYAERRRRTEHALELLPSLLDGQEVTLPDEPSEPVVRLLPAVARPPFWIGNAALRRAARYGDAWFPSLIAPSIVAQGAERLAEWAAGHGRPTPSITVGASGALGSGPGLPTAHELAVNIAGTYGGSVESALGLPVTGSAAAVAERFAAYGKAGATHMVIGLAGPGWREQCEVLAESRVLLAQG